MHRTPILSTAQIVGALRRRACRLKCESFQKTGSFKARGALNKVLSLSDGRARARARHRLGRQPRGGGGLGRVVARLRARSWSCRRTRRASKLEAVRGYGAEIVLHDDRPTLFDRLNEVREARGLTFVHPFDDPVVLAGAGTAGLEIAEDVPRRGARGRAGRRRRPARRASPRPSSSCSRGVRVVAVELAEGPGLAPALAAGKPVPVPRPATIADGMTPPFVGALPLAIAREAVDEIVSVTEAEILEGMRLLMTRAKLYVEGSGAAATAALVAGKVAPEARRGARLGRQHRLVARSPYRRCGTCRSRAGGRRTCCPRVAQYASQPPGDLRRPACRDDRSPDGGARSCSRPGWPRHSLRDPGARS